MSTPNKFAAIVLGIFVTTFGQACIHHTRREIQAVVGSHQVKTSVPLVTMHGHTIYRIGDLKVIKKDGDEALFYKDSVGKGIDLTIKNDDVTVNGKLLGRLRSGDSVQIGSDGITVNQMDYGETEKYLASTLIAQK